MILNTNGFEGQRLDKVVVELTKLSRATVQNLIKNGYVKNNSVIINDNSYKIKNNSVIEYEISQTINTLQPKEMKLDIIYEDDDLIVINKPSGLTTHPNGHNDTNTLVNVLISQYDTLSNIAGSDRLGIVHRLDKDTSGLMIVAKNNESHLKLKEQLKNRELKRKYIGLVWGVFSQMKGEIKGYVKRNGLKMSFFENEIENSKYSLTNYRTIKTYLDNSLSMLEFELDTGRMHQIRCHCAYKKHPIIGDKMYGGSTRQLKDLYEIKKIVSNFPRQALHSYKISFRHPRTDKLKEFEIELADDIKELIGRITINLSNHK